MQQELEEQLRAFGDTMSDAFAHGFEGRGMDIGDRAFDVGKAAVHAANYGISEAGKAMRQARDSYYQSQRQAHANGGTAEQYARMPQWARNFFASRPELTPVEKLRKCAKERYSSGVALLAVGIIFAVLFGLGTLGCLIGLGIISPAALGDVVVSTAEGGGILMTGTDYVMNTAYNVLGIVSSVLGLATAGFGWMAACGVSQREAGRQMGQLADLADSMDGGKGLPVEMLADLTHQKKKKTLKRLKKSIRKGWLNAWLDEKTETVYLTAEDYRAAQERPEPQPAPAQPEQGDTAETPLNLETARRFAQGAGTGTAPHAGRAGPGRAGNDAKDHHRHLRVAGSTSGKPAQGPPLCGILYPHHPEAAAHLQRCAGPAGRKCRDHPPGYRGHPAHPESGLQQPV